MANLVHKALRVLKNEGLDVVLYKTKYRFDVKNIYKNWIMGNERNILYTEKLSYNPLFSVVVPVYNVADNMLRECIDSIKAQTYRNFEIILVDDASTMESVRDVLREYENEENITVIYRKENGHISRATNDGIKAAKGEFVALCDCDDLYAPNALYEIAKKLNENKEYDFIYSDEDKISEDGRVRRDPFFKPDWSPETFMSYMYTCHLSVYRKSLLEELSGLRVGFEGSQDYDLVLRLMEKTTRIGHVPKILYHWRMRKESTANALTAKPYIMEATVKAKKEAIERRGLIGELTLLPEIGQYRVTYIPQGNPKVSVIIPSKDNVDVLSRCIKSICGKTAYKNYEIVLVDNGSSEDNKARVEKLTEDVNDRYGAGRMKYIYRSMDFNFSAMCNIGAENASGDYYLFLNDDIEIAMDLSRNRCEDNNNRWMDILLGQAQVSYAGAVGCKLYYPDRIHLQHAGVLNLQIGPGHCLYGSQDNLNYYYGRNLLDYNFTVVTGACLMVDKKKFEKAGGFDEELPVAYNDVALCFKLVELGYYNVLRNDVGLIHHESVSRGLDEASQAKEERRKREMKKLYDKFPEFAGGYDPCYNPNLTPDRGDFSFDMSKAFLPEKPERADGYTQDDGRLVYSIDSVLTAEDTIRVNGWIYNRNKKNNNHNKVEVILKNDNDQSVYRVKTKHMYRPDVASLEGIHKGYALSGFETLILKNDLKPGSYTVGASIGRRYVCSNRKVVIGDK